MSKKMKKTMSMLLVVTLIAVIAVGGMLAYLTSEDSDVNVMTLGEVKIEQIEQERDNAGNLVDFTQAKPLYPAVYPGNSTSDSIPWADGNDWPVAGNVSWRTVQDNGNVVDKFVTVKNTGKSDAYVRTIIAFEGEAINGTDIHLVCNGTDDANLVAREFVENVVINGVRYDVIVFTYKNALAAGETSIPSLKQIYMDHTCTNEDVAKYGKTYDVLVLSQAVQTNGFANAEAALAAGFGEANTENVVRWFAGEEFKIPEVVSDYYGLMWIEDDKCVLSEDMDADDMIFFYGKDATVDLNGKTITAKNKGQYTLAAPTSSTLHLTGKGTVNMGKGFFATGDDAEIIVDAGTYNGTVSGTLNNMKHISLAQNNGKIVINGGTFTTDVEDAALFFATSNARIEINGGFFENTADETPDLLNIGTNKGNTNRIILKGGTFVNWNPLKDRMCYTGTWPANGEAAFGGPWILIPGDYEVISETQSDGDVWYSVVPK